MHELTYVLILFSTCSQAEVAARISAHVITIGDLQLADDAAMKKARAALAQSTENQDPDHEHWQCVI
jgi:Zn finger protein HypA/HybF involved in hydrogenase expression